MSNNEAEFMATYQGLKIAKRNGYRKLEIEGDSALVINTIKKINTRETMGASRQKLENSKHSPRN